MKDHHSKATTHFADDNGIFEIVWVWDPGKGSLISYHQKPQYTHLIDLDEISIAVPKCDIKNAVLIVASMLPTTMSKVLSNLPRKERSTCDQQ
jgi:hypothetical protein